MKYLAENTQGSLGAPARVSNLSINVGVNGQPYVQSLDLTAEKKKIHRYLLNRRLDGPQNRSGFFGEEKKT